MRSEQSAVLGSLRRAQQFLDAHSDVITAVTPSTRKQLDDVITQLATLSVAQDTGARGSRGETSRQRALHLALRRTYMAPVAQVAKFTLRDVPEFSALRLPPANANAETTVIAAYAMANAAEPHSQTLIDNGLRPSFAADLRSAAAGVSDSLSGRTEHQGRRTGATAGLRAEQKRGQAVLGVLNAVIRGQLETDSPLLAEWTAAKLVRRKPGPVSGSQANGHAGDPVPVQPVVLVSTSPTLAPAPTPTPTPTPVAVAA